MRTTTCTLDLASGAPGQASQGVASQPSRAAAAAGTLLVLCWYFVGILFVFCWYYVNILLLFDWYLGGAGGGGG